MALKGDAGLLLFVINPQYHHRSFQPTGLMMRMTTLPLMRRVASAAIISLEKQIRWKYASAALAIIEPHKSGRFITKSL